MTSYESINALNWSTLKNLAKSPLEYQWRLSHPEPRKISYILGSAIHCLVLEPEKFNKRYALCEMKRDKRTMAYKAWLEDNGRLEPLTADEWDTAHLSAEAVRAHPVAKRILEPCRCEEPLQWIDPITGLSCKGRVDAISPTYIVDLKSTVDPSPRKFTRDAATYLYHGQISFYETGARATRNIAPTGDSFEPSAYIIAAGKLPPYDVAVYFLSPYELDVGRNLCLSLMRKLEECIASDIWPGSAPDLLQLELQAERQKSWCRRRQCR